MQKIYYYNRVTVMKETLIVHRIFMTGCLTIIGLRTVNLTKEYIFMTIIGKIFSGKKKVIRIIGGLILKTFQVWAAMQKMITHNFVA